jgi:hypothetical protein
LWGFSFSFAESIVTSVISLHMLEAFWFSQQDEIENPDVMFQQDGGLLHFSNVLR